MRKKNKAIKKAQDLYRDTCREIDECLKIEYSIPNFLGSYGPSKEDLAEMYLLDPRWICFVSAPEKYGRSICHKRWSKSVLFQLFYYIQSGGEVWKQFRGRYVTWIYTTLNKLESIPLSEVKSLSLFLYGMENYETSVFLKENLDKDIIEDLNTMSYFQLKEYDSILKSLKGRALKKSTYLYLNNVDPIYWTWVDYLYDCPLNLVLSSLEDLVYIYGEDVLLLFEGANCFQDILDFIDLYPFFQEYKGNYIEVILEIVFLLVRYKLDKPQLVFLSECPSWCSERVWKDFIDNRSVKACELLLKIKDLLIKKYSPNEYFYICLARDSVPLYVLLMQSSLDCMLGIFSRVQIGDTESVNLLKKEIEYAKNITNKKPVIVDIQGTGSIYDYLSNKGIDCEKVFACSYSNKYPTLFPVGKYYKKAIKYIEKLPHNTGRPEGVYKKAVNGTEEFFVAWGTTDPNAVKAGDNSWSDILQYRGLLYAHMNIDPTHAGMIGNSPIQRLWGIYKNYYDFNNIPSMGININEDVYTQHVLGARFKNLFETSTSKGSIDISIRTIIEEFYFGKTGIHPIYGVLTDDSKKATSYGNIHCIINIKNIIPYITITMGDSMFLYEDDEDSAIFWDLLKFPVDNKIPCIYHEVQYNTLMISSLVKKIVYVNQGSAA